MSPLPAQAASTAAPKLELRGVTKTFEGRQVLDGVDIAIQPGRSLVIIGASGQGKSVTLKIAVGLMRPDAGQVFMDGDDMTELRTAERSRLHGRLGMLFQGSAPVRQPEGLAERRLPPDQRRQRRPHARPASAPSRRWAASACPRDVADRYPAEISGGMQKRVGLARAVVAHPEILFFDEPTTGWTPSPRTSSTT